MNFQALVSLYSLLFLRLAQPRKVRAQLVFEAKGTKYGVASAVILDFFHLVSDDFRVGKLNESNFVFKLLQPDNCLVLPLRQTVTKISVSSVTDFGANTIIHALSLEIMEAGNETFLRIKISSPSKDINSQSWKKEQLMRQFNILLPFPSQKTCRLIIFYFGFVQHERNFDQMHGMFEERTRD